MNAPREYQLTNASRYRPENAPQNQPPARCSCLGIVIALIVVSTLLVILATYSGNIIFMGDPLSHIMMYVQIIAPIIICALVIRFATSRVNAPIPD